MSRGGARPGAGRKPAALGRKPATPVGFRPTELERAAIEQACAEAGVSVSEWLRRLVRRELRLGNSE